MNRAIYYSLFLESSEKILSEFKLLKKKGCLPLDARIVYKITNFHREVTEVIFEAEEIKIKRQLGWELCSREQEQLPAVIGVDEKIY